MTQKYTMKHRSEEKDKTNPQYFEDANIGISHQWGIYGIETSASPIRKQKQTAVALFYSLHQN